jgi:hypothetical protein
VKMSEYTTRIVKQYCEISGVPEAAHLASIADVALYEWAKDAERRWPEIVAMMAELKELRKNKEVIK